MVQALHSWNTQQEYAGTLRAYAGLSLSTQTKKSLEIEIPWVCQSL